MSYRPKILAFAGSLRQKSYNKKLIRYAIEGAKEAGADVVYIELNDFPLPIYDATIEEEEGLPPTAIKIKDLMNKSDGFIIASPEYNSSVSGVLKNTIDWASRKATPEETYLGCFIDKVALILSASQGPLGGVRGLSHLRSILENIYTWVMPQQKTIPNAAEAFDDQGCLKNPKQIEDIKNLGKKLTLTIKKLKE